MNRIGALRIPSYVAAALLICGAAPPPPADLSGVVAELFQPPEKILRLAPQTRSKDKKTRDQALDELVPLLRKGMTRKQVETLIGPPKREQHDAEQQTMYVTYDCRSKKFPLQAWWRIAYDTKKKPYCFLHSWRDSPLESPVEDR